MDIDKTLEVLATGGKRIATETLDRAIGLHVLALIEHDGEISVNALMESLRHTIDTSISGDKERPDQVLPRMQAEAALSRVEGLLNPPG